MSGAYNNFPLGIMLSGQAGGVSDAMSNFNTAVQGLNPGDLQALARAVTADGLSGVDPVAADSSVVAYDGSVDSPFTTTPSVVAYDGFAKGGGAIRDSSVVAYDGSIDASLLYGRGSAPPSGGAPPAVPTAAYSPFATPVAPTPPPVAASPPRPQVEAVMSGNSVLLVDVTTGEQLAAINAIGENAEQTLNAIAIFATSSPLALQGFIAASQAAGGEVNVNADSDLNVNGRAVSGLYDPAEPNTLGVNPEAQSGVIDFGMTVIHELGHMLGLQHGEAMDAWNIQVADQFEAAQPPGAATELNQAMDAHQHILCAVCDPDLEGDVNSAEEYDQAKYLSDYGTEQNLLDSLDFQSLRSVRFAFDPTVGPGIYGASGEGVLKVAGVATEALSGDGNTAEEIITDPDETDDEDVFT